MTRDQHAAERTAEDILHGRIAALEGEDRALAETMAALRSTAASAPPPRPSEQLLQVFSDGVPAEDREAAAPAGALTAQGRSTARRRTTLRPRLARLAGLSLAAKIALAGTATAAASIGGAGAAGLLPGQDDQRSPAEPVEEAEADFGGDVADEATDTDGGVSGPDVSEEARLLRERGARADAEAREAERREEEARERSENAGEQREEPGQRGSSDTRGRADEAPGTGPTTGPRSGAEGRDHADERTSGTPGQAPTERAPTQDRARQAPEPGGPAPDRTEPPERDRDATNDAESEDRPAAESDDRSGSRPDAADREVGETPLPSEGAGRP